MNVGLDVAGDTRELFFIGDARFGGFAFLQDALRLLLILPKIGL